MVLDIRYYEKAPEQLRGVRRVDAWPNAHAPGEPPSLLIQFYNNGPDTFILLPSIAQMTITKD